MLLLGLVLAAQSIEPTSRASVTRAAFEDRHAMVLVGPPDGGAGLWIAFNPRTASIMKVWDGTLDRRGKVFDFSQENSRAEGKVIAAAPDELVRLPDGPAAPRGWQLKDVRWQGGGWHFDSAGASITSPPFDRKGMQDVYVAFDEASRKARLNVSVLTESGAPTGEQFQSGTHVTSDTEWQWNYKRILVGPGRARVRAFQTAQSDNKSVRNLRVFADPVGWTWGGVPVRSAQLVAYQLLPERAVLIECRLTGPDGDIEAVTVTVKPYGRGFSEENRVVSMNPAIQPVLPHMATARGSVNRLPSGLTLSQGMAR
ncbi:MAG: hypothetical protein AB7F50_04440 [Fimbriimonadaceae bacterium]